MKDALKVLRRKDHKKMTDIISPIAITAHKKVKDYPFFGMLAGSKKSVNTLMTDLRGGRYKTI